MTNTPSRDQVFADAYNDQVRYPTIADVATALGLATKTVKNYASVIRHKTLQGDLTMPTLVSRIGRAERVISAHESTLEIDDLPSADEPIEALIERVIYYNEKQRAFADAKNCVDIRVKINGPFGVAGIPDPHLNNPGTNLRRAMREAYQIRDTEGLYAVGIGDWLDNFIIGRLERERRGDIMSHGSALRLQEHFVMTVMHKLVAAIGGNHNDWPTSLGGEDVLGSMFETSGLRSIYDADQVRVRLISPNGASFTHLARHKYPGTSQWNPLHGIVKWIAFNWEGEDVLWGGHIHQSSAGYVMKKHQGVLRKVRGIQLAAYKEVDPYAVKCGFSEGADGRTPMVIHIPETGDTLFYEDLDEGIARLNELRAAY